MGDRASGAQARPPAAAHRSSVLLRARFSLHILLCEKLVNPPEALYNLNPETDRGALFEQIQKPLPPSRFEVGPGMESAASAAGPLLVVTLELAVGLTLLAQESALGTMAVW